MQFDDKDLVKKKPTTKAASTRKKQVVQATVPADQPEEKMPSVPAREITPADWLRLIDLKLSFGIIALTFAVPLFFLPFTADTLEFNKQALLVFGTLLIALLASVRALVARTITIQLSSLMIPLATLLCAWLASSTLSHYPALSFLGFDRQEFTSLITVASLALYALLLAHTEKRVILFSLGALVASLAIRSILGVLSLYGISPLGSMGPVETWGVMSVLALLLSVGLLALVSWMNPPRRMSLAVFLAVSIGIQLITLFLLDDWRLWAGMIAGLVCSIAILFWKLKDERTHAWVAVPSVLLVIAILGLVVHMRIVQLPLSVQPTWLMSANLSWETVKESPLFGFGPGTFLETYTRFRPVSINTVNYLNLWAARFDQASAVSFTAFAAVGSIGMIALGILLLMLVRKIILFLKKSALDEDVLLLLSLCMPIGALLLMSFLKPSNMTLAFTSAVLFGAALSVLPKTAVRFASEQSNRFLILSSSLISFAGAGVLLALVVFSSRYGGELAFAQALATDRALSGRLGAPGNTVTADDVDAVIGKLNEAIKKDPYVDMYYRTQSQALLTKTTMLISAGAQDITAIQLLAEQVIASAKRAAELNKNDVRNLENLANIYQQLAVFTGGAEGFAVDALKKARELDPSNPQIHLSAAKMYLQLADAHRKRASTEKDPKSSPETALAVKAALSAEQEAQEALKLKGDLPAAHYYLAIVKSQTGNNKEAVDLLIKAAQENTALIPNQAADRELFSQLATSFAAIGESQKALDTVKIALSLMPDDPQSLWLYGNLLADGGNKDEAITVLGKLLEKNPKNDAVIKRLQELKGIESAPAEPSASSTIENDAADEPQEKKKKE